jgi:hypothetical protein
MKTAISIMVTLAALNWGIYGWTAEPPPPTPAAEQPEVLTSGPVNEAFAEPVNLENQTGIVTPSQPPENIEEVPPEERPVGDEFVWVPGYWGWDPSRNGYIWVSGCWRAAPPKMYWVPGYWTAVAGGWQWVAGFWSPAASNEIEYLPEPPALTDVGPLGPAPSADRIWVPPCWYWNHGQYIRRSGYWVRANPDWVWVPSHYPWTPRGYVFVPGHWDYSFRRRGVLFAPVYFPRHYYGRPGFFYPLSIVVDIANLESGLFTYPRYSHYYFGDYYGDNFIRIGLYPWFECVSRHTWYDPIYFHDRWRYSRTEPRWEERERQNYRLRLADRRLRPPRTYREMESRIGRLPESQRRGFRFAEPMKTVVSRKTTTIKFERMKNSTRKQLTRQSPDVRTFREQRSKWESQGPGTRKGQPTVERVPAAERRRTAAPTMERKGQEMKPSGRERVTPAPIERRGPEAAPTEGRVRQAQPPERKQGVPGQVPGGRKKPEMQPQERQEKPSAERRAPVTITRPQERPASVSRPEGPQRNSERVKVPTPPVSSKKGGLSTFRKGPPSQPAEERKTENKKTRKEKEKEAQQGGDQGRGGGERDKN